LVLSYYSWVFWFSRELTFFNGGNPNKSNKFIFLSPISLSLIGGNFFSMIITLLIFIGSLGAWSFGLKLKLSAMMEEPENYKSNNTKL
jgi:hypothetical protein